MWVVKNTICTPYLTDMLKIKVRCVNNNFNIDYMLK